MFSKSCEYGLRAVLYIGNKTSKKKKISLTTIASEINSPPAFTAKILQQLTKNNIVSSVKGPYGGFYIDEENLNTILLSDVVNIFDGNSIYTGCGLGLSKCDSKSPCPLHHKFIEIRANLKEMLNITLAEALINNTERNLIWLKR